jgi:hypothetical protein
VESRGKRVAAILLFVGALAVFAGEISDVVPIPKVRPEDPSRFFPSMVRLDEGEVAEVATAFRRLGHEDLALQVEKSRALRAVPPDVTILTRMLAVSSERVKEWALRGLGEHSGDKRAATPALLQIACDGRADEMSRALAVRVLGTTPMDSETVTKLVSQVGSSGKELSALLLEMIGSAGEAAEPVVPALRKFLNAPEALVQYYAFEALQKLDRSPAGAEQPAHYHAAQRLARLDPDASAAELPARSLAALEDPTSPGYLRGVALRKLVASGDHPKAVRAVLNSVGDSDAFISELAANVLAKTDGIAAIRADVLAASLAHADGRVRLHSAAALRRMGPKAVSAVPAIANLMREASAGRANIRETGVCLDVLRVLGSNAVPASAAVAALLPENCAVYRSVEKHEVDRFRGFLFATLAEIGVPKEALPFIADALVNSDNRMSYAFAGAARAAGASGRDAAELLPHLVRPLEKDVPQDFLSFAEFDAHFVAGGEYTTCQAESLRALRRIGPPARNAAPVVRAFLDRAEDWVASPQGTKRMPKPTVEARETLAVLEAQDTRKARLDGNE